jgi:transcriptional repressor NrdR
VLASATGAAYRPGTSSQELASHVRCPACGADDDRVVDSRPTPSGDAIRRRRECRACGLRFTTFERAELPELLVRKRSGAVAPFARSKVLDGMSRAAKGRVPAEALEAAAVQVERALRTTGAREVTSEQVGLQVLTQLRALDPVAYVRFASVYKDFQGPEDFELELSSLRKEAPPKSA